MQRRWVSLGLFLVPVEKILGAVEGRPLPRQYLHGIVEVAPAATTSWLGPQCAQKALGAEALDLDVFRALGR